MIRWRRFFNSSLSRVFVLLLGFAFAQEAPSLGKLNRGFETGPSQDIHSLIVSPDGHLIVQGGRDLRVFDAASGQLVWTLHNFNNAEGVALSPDGKWLVSDRTSQEGYVHWLGIYRVSDGLKVLTKKFTVQFITALTWSSDGRWIVVNGGAALHFLHAGNLEFDSTLAPLCRWALDLAWRPGASELAVACQDGSVERYSVGGEVDQFLSQGKVVGKTRDWVFTPENRHNGYGRLAWSPDGTRLAFVWDHTVTLLDGESGEPTLEFVVDPERLGLTDAIAWSPDASLLAMTGGDNQRIMLHDAKTGQHLLDLGPRRYNPHVTFSPDSRFLIGAPTGESTSLSVWGAVDGSPVFDAAHWRR